MKFERQNLILKLINEKPIDTQREITDLLLAAGYDVTQATVSRDIKELHITKALSKEGVYRYMAANTEKTVDSATKFRSIFRESVLSVDYACNIIVVKTLPGVANAAALAVEAMNMCQIVGALAGDDTVFFVVRSEDIAASMCREITAMLD